MDLPKDDNQNQMNIELIKEGTQVYNYIPSKNVVLTTESFNTTEEF